MRRAQIFVSGILAGHLIETRPVNYVFEYTAGYSGPPVSWSMPVSQNHYEYSHFPPFFDGLLPEGPQLEALLREAKLDRTDLFGQLVQVGNDLVGVVTIRET